MRSTGVASLTLTLVASIATLAQAQPVTVLYKNRVVEIAQTLADPNDLWVIPTDLPRVNDFVLEPEGACLEELCIPVRQDRDSEMFVTRGGQGWFNVTALARTFKLGAYFYGRDQALARAYWKRAQALAPDNWNYHRQDWNQVEGLAGPQYREKRGGLGDKPYYAPLDLPEPPDAARPQR